MTLWAALGGALATLDLAIGFLVQNVFSRGRGEVPVDEVGGGARSGNDGGGGGHPMELVDLRKAESPL